MRPNEDTVVFLGMPHQRVLWLAAFAATVPVVRAQRESPFLSGAWSGNVSSTSHDAALLLTLEPGSYTLQASSIGGVAGSVVIEVFEVP